MSAVTGASGRVGRLLTAELARRGERVRLLVRGPSGAPDVAGLTSYAAIRAGELDVVTDDYRTLTGRDPLPLSEIVRRPASPRR